jgi:hypothetical protein
VAFCLLSTYLGGWPQVALSDGGDPGPTPPAARPIATEQRRGQFPRLRGDRVKQLTRDPLIFRNRRQPQIAERIEEITRTVRIAGVG